MSKTNSNHGQALKALSEIFDNKEVVRCDCGSATFIDWGMQILDTSNQLSSPRLKGLAQTNSVKICTQCHKPRVHYAGDLYDATEFVTQEAIEQIIQQTQQTQKTPVPVKSGSY